MNAEFPPIPSNFLINASDIITKWSIYQNGPVRFCRGQLNQKDIIFHILPVNYFSTSEMSKFISLLLFLSHDVSSVFMKIIGISIIEEQIYIVYEDDNLREIELEKLSNDEKMTVLTNSVVALRILDHFNFSYNSLKLCYVFHNSNNEIKFGGFTPYPNIFLDPDDHKIFYAKDKLDVMIFGIFASGLITGLPQTEILDMFWKFSPIIPDDAPFSALIQKCLKLAPVMRPSISEIYDEIVHDTFVPPEIHPLSDEELIKQFLFFSDLCPFFDVILGGYFIEKHQQKTAIKYIQKSMYSPISMNNYALLLFKHAPEQAFQIMKAAADMGYALAQNNLSNFYHKGIGVQQDEEKSLTYLLLAADQGYTDSLRIATQRLRKSMKIEYRKYMFDGAYRGDVHCLSLLCPNYDEGFFIPENEDGAKYISEAAAAMGSWVMCNYYADWMKYDGNYPEAFKYAMLGAQQGVREAELKIGMYYIHGIGCEKNPEEAAKWMKRASDKGLAEAMFNYAQMLKEGYGVEKDEDAANKLCALASKQRVNNILKHESANCIIGEFHQPTPYLYFLKTENE